MQQALALLRPFGVDLFCTGKKFLVFNLVSRNLKVKYRRSALGVLWTLLSPLAQAAVFYFVFKVVMKVQIPHYLAFILSGVLPWALFAQTISEGMSSVVGSITLLTKIPIPIQVFPYVASVTNLITLAFSLPILIGASVVSDVHLGLSVLLVVPYLLGLFLVAYSLSLILSIAYVYFRDLGHLIGIVLQIWFYGTPVIYDASMIPAKYHWVLYLNPVGFAFVGLHDILSQGRSPQFFGMGLFAAWTLSLTLIAAVTHRMVASDVVENL